MSGVTSIVRIYLLVHQVGFHAPSNTIPSKRYQFERQLDRHGLRYIHAEKKYIGYHISFVALITMEKFREQFSDIQNNHFQPRMTHSIIIAQSQKANT